MKDLNVKDYRDSVRPIAVLTAVMILSGSIGACSKAEETTSATAASGTTEAETSAEETTSEPEATTSFVYEPQLYAGFESTNGALEGQSEYMKPRYEVVWDKTYEIDDISSIEDEDVRAAAQDYADRGYTLYTVFDSGTYGDIEYEFCVGFEAELIEGDVLKTVSVWKMNETLFDYFILERAVYWDEDEGTLEDDGTVIRNYLDNERYYHCFEFNRDTGLMTCFVENSDPDQWNSHIVNSERFRDDNVRALAESCLENGFGFSAIGDPDVTANDYDISLGFRGSTGGYNDCGWYIEVYTTDEDTFNEYWVEGMIEYEDDYEVKDDGNLITYYVFDYEEVIQYDRETGIVIILMDCNMDNEASSRDYLDLGLDMVHGRI